MDDAKVWIDSLSGRWRLLPLDADEGLVIDHGMTIDLRADSGGVRAAFISPVTSEQVLFDGASVDDDTLLLRLERLSGDGGPPRVLRLSRRSGKLEGSWFVNGRPVGIPLKLVKLGPEI